MKSILGKERIRAEAPQFLTDESRYTLGVPEEIWYPESIDDIRSGVAQASADNRAVTVVGGQTGIAGGCVPTDGCTVLCLEKMGRILGVETLPDGRPVLICQPAITLEEIAAFCADPGARGADVPGASELIPGRWFYPPDPTEMTAQLGGSVAANASGARSLRYGATRRHIRTAKIVLANGETLTLRRNGARFENERCDCTTDQGTAFSLPAMRYVSPPIKNAAGFYSAPGMDLIDLFIGSEGTLGIFAEIGIALTQSAPVLSGLSFFTSRENAFDCGDWLRPNPAVAAIEYFDTTSLALIREYQAAISLRLPDFPAGAAAAIYWEFREAQPGAFEEVMEQWEAALQGFGSSFDATWSGFEPEERARLKTFRHSVPELVNFRIARLKQACPSIRKVGTDAAVPADRFRNFIATCMNDVEASGLQAAIFGHLGDYHLHINMLPATEAELSRALTLYARMMDQAIQNGGTISAEHGVGKLKRDYLRKMVGDAALSEMKRIKSILDPSWIFNPGNLFER
jgi:D-lactate dehydrogenase (cytochrome)